MTTGAGDDRVTAEAAEWQRRHLRAASAWVAVLGALLFAAFLQMFNPDGLGGIAPLSVGRLRVAANLVALYGCAANLILYQLYQVWPGLGRWMVRWHLAPLKFAALNACVMPAALAMVLFGILPPLVAQNVWFGLGHSIAAVAMVLFLWPGPFDGGPGRVRWLMLTGGLALTVAMVLRLIHGFGPAGWALTAFGAVPIMFGGVLGWLLLRRWLPAMLPGFMARTGHVMMVIGLLFFLPLPFLADAQDDGPAAMTASELRGRQTFIREGCVSCHQPFYTNEIGRDLAHEFGARSADWHFTHLFNPRFVSPTSVMPSFARYFDGAPDRPTQEARDLVAYLETLGRREELGTAPNLAKAVPASRARRAGDVPALPAGDRTAGLALFGQSCIGCHGVKGEGDGPGAAGLRPKPANFAAHRYTAEQIAFVLWNGVAGSAMPAWRDRTPAEIASLVAAVQSLSASASHSTDPAPAPELLERGAKTYATHCVQCHGERAGGDGFSAAALPMAPANFQRQQPTLDYALRAIANGVEGTPMAPWTSRLSEDETLAVAHYVRSLFQGGAR